MSSDPPVKIEGLCQEPFNGVRQALAHTLESGRDVGASAAVVIEGAVVVDIWGGYADAERTRPWERDTIVNVFSTTKTMTALCALILADRRQLDLHAPVKRYWPEFGAEGKAEIEVRHLLGHTSGMAGWDQALVPRHLADWERCTGLLAAQAPWWAPGSASGYHTLTHGYLVGEVVRRITGMSVGQFFADEVAGPLGADFHIGLPPNDDGRVAALIPPPQIDLVEEGFSELAIRSLQNPLITGEEANEEWWRRAEIPAANGHGNARSVAEVQSVISCGGEVRGTRLLSEAGVEALFEEQSNGTDLVLGVPLRFGMGYGLASETIPGGPRTCAWGGYGGSIVVNDLDAGITVSYVMNRMEAGLIGDDRGASIVMAAIAGIAQR